MQPDKLFYWDLGEPLERFRRINEARCGEVDGVYGRDFTKGKVLVNPTNGKRMAVKLSREYYDPDSGRPVREVRLAPLSAKILLFSPGASLPPSERHPAAESSAFLDKKAIEAAETPARLRPLIRRAAGKQGGQRH